jgi:integrase
MFLLAATQHRLEAAYMLTLALGLRRGEVLGLSWPDVSVAEDAVVLKIQRQLIRDKTGVHLTDLMRMPANGNAKSGAVSATSA